MGHICWPNQSLRFNTPWLNVWIPQKFGVRTRPLNVIKKLYKNLKMEWKMGKKKNLIDYSTGRGGSNSIAKYCNTFGILQYLLLYFEILQ